MLTKFFCGLLGHGNLIRERINTGTEENPVYELGYRCEHCMAVMPNTFNQIAGVPTEPNYRPAKAQRVG